MLSGFEHLHGFAVCASLHELDWPAHFTTEIGGPAFVQIEILAHHRRGQPETDWCVCRFGTAP